MKLPIRDDNKLVLDEIELTSTEEMVLCSNLSSDSVRVWQRLFVKIWRAGVERGLKELEALRDELDDEKRCRMRACAMLSMSGDGDLDELAHALCVDELGAVVAERLFPLKGPAR